MSCNCRVIKLTLLMTCKLALKSIPNHENNYIATQNYYDRQLLFAYKVAGDVYLYFLILSRCHNLLFNKYLLNSYVPETVLGTGDTLVNKTYKLKQKKMLDHMTLIFSQMKTHNKRSELHIVLHGDRYNREK